MKAAALALLAALVIAAPKPVPADPSLTPGSPFDTTYGGTVAFDVDGLSKKDSRTASVDVQCYGSASGGTDNVGWWDTAPASSATFVLGSSPTTAPPDLGSVIYLSWSNFPGTVDMDCTARLFTAHKKKGVSVLDEYTFSAT